MNITHHVKCIQPFFDDIVNGDKTFEVRINDRNYSVGDHIVLDEYAPDGIGYTGNNATVSIDYLVDISQFTGTENTVGMSITVLDAIVKGESTK